MHENKTEFKSELSSIKDIVKSAFEQMEEQVDARIPKSFYTVLILYLSIKGRLNFLQFSRYSTKSESGLRYFFEKEFNFLKFNKELLKQYIGGKKAIAFDPSHILKTGKKTPGVGYFWSGCSGASKWGLELCGIAVLDMVRKTAFHLFGFQTIDLQEGESLTGFYARKLIEKKKELLELSKYLIADAYFSKSTFVLPCTAANFEVISRLRDDADLRYIYKGEQKKGRGRKREYDGKIDVERLQPKYMKLVSSVENEVIYSGIVNCKSLNKNIKIVVVYDKSKTSKRPYKIYFSTDLKQNWEEILEMYRLRFQIEFLYRDAKQFTGLNDCQARSINKLNFHWNISLSAINLAKIAHWIPLKDSKPNENVAFSMKTIKTLYHNELMVNQFISLFGINTELESFKAKIKQFISWGIHAA